MMATLVWFRQDLRLHDNPALWEASLQGDVVPVYIWSPQEEASWRCGSAAQAWLTQSLSALDESLKERGSALVIEEGPSLQTLLQLAEKTGARRIFWNRRYEPSAVQRDLDLIDALAERRIATHTFNANLLLDPWEITTKDGHPYRVFSRFYQTLKKIAIPSPQNQFPKFGSASHFAFRGVKDLPLRKILPKGWKSGETEALRKWRFFLKNKINQYERDRDRPDREGVSKMSPHLHFGEISPRLMWSMASKQKGSAAYLRELAWREFAYHLLFHFPYTALEPMREEYRHFPWLKDQDALNAWKEGKTGYPIVDAGMRQLKHMGWMHNRVRMIAASFLTKDLLIPWQEGALWFWETLVDADLANNTLGWQWVSGCGADSAPYFRVFNPVAQGEKYDPQGNYVRNWIPELKHLPGRWIHQPWEAPLGILEMSGVFLGKNYPFPIVDHARARERALDAFKKMRKKR